MAPILVYTMHPNTVHVDKSFQLYSFHSSLEICYENFQEWQNLKTYDGTQLQELWAHGHHSATTSSLP